MEIIAHRGDSFTAPENTLAAFALGWSQVDTCELDIWPTSDGRLLVCHDDNTKRTTGANRVISRQSLAELQQLEAGSWKDARYLGEKLPSLAEVLASMPPGKRLLIEIKSGAGAVPSLKTELEAAGKTAQVSLQSFDYVTCVAAKNAFPDTPVYYLSELRLDPKTNRTSPLLDDLILKTRTAGLNGLGLQNHPVLDSAYVRRIHDAALRVYVWTVDEPAEARRLCESNVDGVITNRPGWLRSQLPSV